MRTGLQDTKRLMLPLEQRSQAELSQASGRVAVDTNGGTAAGRGGRARPGDRSDGYRGDG